MTANQSLTERPAWKALEKHHAQIRDLHLRQLFADDSQRGKRLTAEAVGGYSRSLMKCQFNKKQYGQRWQADTIISVIKRRLSDCLGACQACMQRRVLNLKVLVYNLMIVAVLKRIFYRAGQHSNRSPR